MSFKNYDSPLYYRAAREAARIERAGDYRQAAAVWTKASRFSRNEANQQWSENRADFCLMQIAREKLKAAFADDLRALIPHRKAAGSKGEKGVRHRLRVYIPQARRS
ncbi:PerC transcriptional activator [Izhakiella capsodis]|uniref:PerC transcriptional activator n=1 Tax=Izhakiella capsodis TaxID=1367852 RepID=A0A1I4X4D3_9GAMM|nr:PerC transcriptional activator [Izhakiella capsodis]